MLGKFYKLLTNLTVIFIIFNALFISEAGAIAPRIWIEAETGDLYAPMQIGTDSNASSDRFIWVTTGTGGYAEYSINIIETGTYNLWGRIIGTTGGRNSFYFAVDSGTDVTWNFPVTLNWNWNRATAIFLEAGQHTLRIKQREYRAQLDRILITNDPGYVPEGLGGETNPPLAAFSANPTIGNPPMTVNFTDQSVPGDATITSWLWNFGDGSGTSSVQNPTYTYNNPGIYDVSLQVIDENSQVDDNIQMGYITVIAGTQPRIWIEAEDGDLYSPMQTGNDSNASSGEFVWWNTAGTEGYVEYSINILTSDTYSLWGRVLGASARNNSFYVSIDANSDITWNFPVAENWNWNQATVVYLEAGQHNLRIKQREYRAQLDRILLTNDPDYVPEGMGGEINLPVADFTGSPTSGPAALTVNFTDLSTGTPTSWLWDFGDGGTSTLQNPSHTYNSDGVYTVTLSVTGAGGSDDEVKADYITVNVLPPEPVADFTGSPTSGPAALTVNFTDLSTGTPTSWLWDFGDGGTSTLQNPSHTYNSDGVYTVTLSVTGAGGSDDEVKFNFISVDSGTASVEHFFAMPIFEFSFGGFRVVLKQELGATQIDDVTWRYINPSGKEWIIHEVRDAAGFNNALRYPGGTIAVRGHANYGSGAAPCTDAENLEGRVNRIRYIDDPGLVNISSKFFDVSISGLRSHFSPYWQPIFQDGESGIMPFGFLDPRGLPPYNYYITYKLNGNRYRIESVHNSGVIRMIETDMPAWDPLGPLASGLSDPTAPDPDNPAHRGFFMTAFPLSSSTEGWQQSTSIPGFYGSNYKSIQAGDGTESVRWEFKIPQASNYKISAFWPESPGNTTNAPFTVESKNGSLTYRKSQTINGGKWNIIDQFDFNADAYFVQLTNDANPGNVIADAIRIEHASNPDDIVQANFRASPRSGPVNTRVSFTNQSTGFVNEWLWDFGDGTTDTSSSPRHYYSAPGIYSVTLKVTGLAGTSETTAVDYIYIENVTPAIQAEFSNSSPTGNMEDIPAEVDYTDRSSSTRTIVSWEWDLNGDNIPDSFVQNPTYTYTLPGLYTVSLKVTDSIGNSDIKIKENYVRANIFDEIVDNTTYPSYHYGSKTVLFRRDVEVPKEELGYKRILYESCTGGPYYLESLEHGIVHYTVGPSANRCGAQWMKGILEGKTDAELWEICQALEAKYDYFDFSKTPSEQE